MRFRGVVVRIYNLIMSSISYKRLVDMEFFYMIKTISIQIRLEGHKSTLV